MFNRIVRQIGNVFFFGNIYMACCAVALLWITYLRAGIPVRLDSLSAFVFFATLFQYTLHRFLALRKHKNSDNEILKWTAENQFLFVMLAIISGGMCANLLFHLTRDTFFLLLFLGTLSLLYELPVFRQDDKQMRLRDIWFFKIILITLVWSCTTAVLPYLQYELNIYSTSFIVLLIQKIALVFIVALAFDIRDMEYDRRDQVITIPIRFGLIRVRKLIIILTALCILTGFIHALWLSPFSMPLILTAQLSPLFSYYIITLAYRYPIDLFFIVAVDGILAVEFIFAMLLKLIF
ncbi:MAG: UbiA family prenyltransferase [Bacteroidota bacterium]